MKLGDLYTVGMVFVVAGILLGIGAKILTTVQSDLSGTAAQVTGNATEGLGEVASWMPTIGLIVAAAIIIGVLFKSFFRGR